MARQIIITMTDEHYAALAEAVPILSRSPVRTFAERRRRGELQHNIVAAT